MPDLPEGAVSAAAKAMDDEYGPLAEWSPEAFAYVALRAAAPLFAAQVRREVAEEIARAIEADDSNSDLGDRTRAWAARLARQIGEAW
ncbi:hypothetical protein ACIBEJ_34860 [Nonomuraea sp. NPDC050790]|uniref:hypothetical protein n=1 Tax=Nonomuraea sp. NPDC050790 TaxID=3364371 RepID=UPI0037A29AB0